MKLYHKVVLFCLLAWLCCDARHTRGNSLKENAVGEHSLDARSEGFDSKTTVFENHELNLRSTHADSRNAENVNEKCVCGENSVKCSFVRGKKTCDCEEGYSDKEGKCEECNCGENVQRCRFMYDSKLCHCRRGFEDNGGQCEECNCGENANVCRFSTSLSKLCFCKEGFEDNGGQCEECDCGRNAESCKFYDGKKICKCVNMYAYRNGSCTGVNEICQDVCGVDAGHANIKCNTDDPQNVTCECAASSEMFDYKKKVCRAFACTTNADCENGGECVERNGINVCLCPKGTTGSNCEIITECGRGGKYWKCQNSGGSCVYDATKQEALCRCPWKMRFNERQGSCQGVNEICQEVCGVDAGDANIKCNADDPQNVVCECATPSERFDYKKKVCKALCDPNPCVHGVCVEVGRYGFSCKCEEGYTGIYCDMISEISVKEIEVGRKAMFAAIILGACLAIVLFILLIVGCKLSKLKKNSKIG